MRAPSVKSRTRGVGVVVDILTGEAPMPLHNDGWDPKYVPDAVKTYISGQQQEVQSQYRTTLLTMASNVNSQGDGLLGYLGYYHKRFGGHWCLLYLWQPRRDGKGNYLAVKGIGRKNGTGNNYSQVI